MGGGAGGKSRLFEANVLGRGTERLARAPSARPGHGPRVWVEAPARWTTGPKTSVPLGSHTATPPNADKHLRSSVANESHLQPDESTRLKFQ